jgi:hypothetical protein
MRFLIREFHCDISMHICIITQIGSSLLFFCFLPKSPYYGDYNMFKNCVYSCIWSTSTIIKMLMLIFLVKLKRYYHWNRGS